jgi:hypothetical protein
MSHKPNILFGKVDPNELTTPSLYHQSQSTTTMIDDAGGISRMPVVSTKTFVLVIK